MSVAVGIGVTRLLPTPAGVVPTLTWWAAVLAVAVISLMAADRLFRRLLPLSALLNLALVFPGESPSRFAAAFRGGTVRNLEARMVQAKANADSADAAEAAATVVELIAALAAHDPRTRGHSERTRAFAELIGEELHLSPEDRDRLRWSALLHDIGKLHVEPALLNKPDRPDDAEWLALQGHPLEGARIVGALGRWLGPWGLAIAQHHEHYDGTGYPSGLVGEEISLAGRIVAVADAYEVMTAVRAYNRPIAPAAARAELVRCAGQHFDPAIVRAFLRVSIARLPRTAAVVTGLVQLPGVLVIQRLLERSSSAVAAGGAAVALVAAGVVVPSAADEPAPRSPSVAAPAPTTEVAGTVVDPDATEAADGAAAEPAPGVDRVEGPVPARSSAVQSSRRAPASTTSTTTTTTTTTTSPTTDTTMAPAPSGPPREPRSGYYLAGTAPGAPFTPAPLQAVEPTGDGTFDYDGDGQPGRTIAPSSQPGTTDDVSMHQIWSGQFGGAALISGTPTLTLPSAVSGFGDGMGHVQAWLLECDVPAAGCIPFASAELKEKEWAGGGFAVKTLTFGETLHVLAAGRTLAVRIGVHAESESLLFAYGAPAHEAFLALDVREI